MVQQAMCWVCTTAACSMFNLHPWPALSVWQTMHWCLFSCIVGTGSICMACFSSGPERCSVLPALGRGMLCRHEVTWTGKGQTHTWLRRVDP